MIDVLFYLAIVTFGWGLSLATYQLFARSNGWPMGAMHADAAGVPIFLGLAALGAGLAFAVARGPLEGGWVIVAAGVLLGLFWTGLLRVGSQVSLLLAPLATALLLAGWLGGWFA